MKLNIEVDTSMDGGISVAISNVSLLTYRNITKPDIDDVVCKAVEVAFIGEGKDRESARIIANAIYYGNSPSRSTYQADKTDHSDSAVSDAGVTHQL